VNALTPVRVLEIAAGTGAVTRELARTLPTTTHIVATDLNQPMLDEAQPPARRDRSSSVRPMR
jgi:ubiquinone/menaquinone biosynthesis C-methylase UbiE